MLLALENVVNRAFLVLIFLGEKLVGANFYAFCNYGPKGQWDKDSRSNLVGDPILLVLRSFLQRQSFQLAGEGAAKSFQHRFLLDRPPSTGEQRNLRVLAKIGLSLENGANNVL